MFLVATSNSLVDQYSDCFLQLKISCYDKAKNVSTLHLEINLAQFQELFSEIEKIKNLIDFYAK